MSGGNSRAFNSTKLPTAGAVPLPGLDPARTYAVRLRPEAGLPAVVQVESPAWWEPALAPGGLVLPGSVLSGVGLAVPVLAPAQGYLLDVRAV